jgi:hypothetical protein
MVPIGNDALNASTVNGPKSITLLNISMEVENNSNVKLLLAITITILLREEFSKPILLLSITVNWISCMAEALCHTCPQAISSHLSSQIFILSTALYYS